MSCACCRTTRRPCVASRWAAGLAISCRPASPPTCTVTCHVRWSLGVRPNRTRPVDVCHHRGLPGAGGLFDVTADHANSPTHLQAFAIIEASLGRPLGEVFSSISERPIAAASLGQVYKGVLRETGQEVAVKVQRPGVEPLIFRDIFIFRTLGTFVNAW